jgi:hypothetical protein
MCALLIASTLIVSSLLLVSRGASADTGDADPTGYYWTDSNEPAPSVTMDWVDISSSGDDSGLAGDSGSSGPFPVGFDFTFYGQNYSMFNVSIDGTVMLGNADYSYNNYWIPSYGSPSGFVAPFWDDLVVNAYGYNTGAVLFETIGSAPDRQLVVEWYEVTQYGSYDLMTFELILNETGEIWFQYNSMSGVDGSSATVGIEDDTGEFGCQYSYNEAVLTDGLAVMFETGPLGFGPDQIASAYASSSSGFWVALTNAQGFTDSFDITNTSELGWPVSVTDGSDVLTDNNGNGIPDTGDIPAGDMIWIWVAINTPATSPSWTENTTVVATSYNDADVWEDVVLTTRLVAAQLVAPYTDVGLDTDSDGLYEYLQVSTGVDVVVAGTYTLSGPLYYSGGSVWLGNAESTAYLAVGAQVMTLEYDGRSIFGGAYNGTFFSYMSIESFGTTHNSYIHETGSYTYDEFERPDAFIEGTITVHPYDANSNGFFDYLVADIPVNVTVAGYYALQCYLHTSSGSYVVNVYNASDLGIGVHTMQAWFSGRDIYSEGFNGTFIVYVYLYNETDQLSVRDNTTDAYTYDQFEPPPASFLPPHSDHGIDADSNGLYELFALDVGVDVLAAGDYQVGAYIYDSTYSYNLWADANYTTLDVGAQTVGFLVPGAAFANSYVDGPYYIDLYLYETSSGDYLGYDLHVTGDYLYTDFDATTAVFDPPHADYGSDDDSDGLFDYIVVGVNVSATIEGYYSIDGELYSPTSVSLSWDSWYGYLSAGAASINLYFDAMDVTSTGEDGPYNVSLELYDDWGTLVDADSYWTAAYSVGMLEAYPASLAPPYSDQGVDADDDGLFDYLSLEVGVDVRVSGTYLVRTWVYDSTRSYFVTSGQVWADLDAGLQTVEMQCPGDEIFSSSVDGPYLIDISLYDADYNWLGDDVHETGDYLYADFDPPAAMFTPPHSESGIDTDSDGLYEYLAVDASVNITVEGDYIMSAYMYGPDGYLCRVETEVNLAVGVQAVQVLFDGWYIYATGVDAEYDVELYLYTDQWAYLDYDYYMTGTLTPSEFDGAPPSLTSVYTNAPPTIDGVFSPGEWEVAAVVDLADVDAYNGLGALMYVANDETYMYICYDVVGSSYSSSYDSASIGFDTGNDETATDGAEDQFAWGSGVANGQEHLVYDSGLGYWVDDCSPFDPLLPDHDGLASAYGYGESDGYTYEHMVYEIAVPLALLGLAPGDTAGFIGASDVGPGVYDGTYDEWSTWPKYFDSTPSMAWYGDLVLATVCPSTLLDLSGDSGWDQWWMSEVTVNLTAFGGDGGVDYTMYRVDGGLWEIYADGFVISAEGYHTLEYYSVDVMGNEEPVQTVEVDIELNPPVTLVGLEGTLGLNGWYTSEVTVTFTVVPSVAPVGGTYYYINDGVYNWYTDPFVLSSEGLNYVDFRTYDEAGWYSSENYFEVMIDAADPWTEYDVTGDLGVGGWYTSDVTVDLYGYDDASGVDMTVCRIDGGAWTVYDSGFVLTADGAHVVDFYTIDLAGREETMQTLLIDIDQLPPVTTASVADEYDVTLTAIDAGIGVDYTMYRLDEGTWTLYTGMFTAGTTGLVLVEFYSVDLMGNIEDVRSVLAGDMVAPTTSYEVEGTAGEAGWYVSDVTIALTSEDNADGSGVDHVSYRIDGESWYTYSVPVGLTAEGEHTFEFYAEDVAGNAEETQSVSIDIDTEAPITAYVVTNSTVTLTASDPTSGVAVVMYRIDGGDWIVYTVEFEVTGGGNHTVEFSATDAAGNVEDVQTIYVDNGASGLSALTIGLVAALAAAVAIGLTLFLFMKKRKGPGVPAPPPQDIPPPPDA